MVEERLKQLRKERNLTQTDLGKVLGIVVSAYGRYELGTTEPDISNLIKLSKFYNVSVDYLLGLTDVRDKNEFQKILDELDPEAQKLLIGIARKLKK